VNNKRSRILIGRVKLQIGQHVRISKEKMKIAKGFEQNYNEEIFKINKMVSRTPRPVYELEDVNTTLILGQFYGITSLSVRPTQLHTRFIG
jgi:hypothetical protein